MVDRSAELKPDADQGPSGLGPPGSGLVFADLAQGPQVAATEAAALQQKEVDWVETPLIGLLS
jgi:hypothetical protein